MRRITWGDPLPEPPPRRPSAGPWTSHDTDEGDWVVDIPNDGEITVTRLYFGDMENNTGRDIANADLVAAAPDLLAALVAAKNDMDEMAYSVVTYSAVTAAIAKAKGESR